MAKQDEIELAAVAQDLANEAVTLLALLDLASETHGWTPRQDRAIRQARENVMDQTVELERIRLARNLNP